MLPMELVIHIFSYLGIKPTKRCKATTLKGKICKNNTDNIDFTRHNYKGNFHLRSKKFIDFLYEYRDILDPRDALNWKSPENYINSSFKVFMMEGVFQC